MHEYSLDLRYNDKLQPALFYFGFPRVLDGWRRCLMCGHCDGNSPDEFHNALVHRPFLDELLNQRQRDAVYRFMADTILDRMDTNEPGRWEGKKAAPYMLFDYLTLFGIYAPSIERLWRVWWECSTPGRAATVLQWVSCLMYFDDENPAFAPWTADKGGGPPRLWMENGLVFSVGWRPTNAEYLRSTCTVDFVRGRTVAAARTFEGSPSAAWAGKFVSDFKERVELVGSRLAELPGFLAAKHQPGDGREWSV